MFTPAPKHLFFKSSKPNDPRLGELVRAEEPTGAVDNTFIIGGYADDTGIEINGGRIGAAQGPDCIRKYLYKCTPAPWTTDKVQLYDIGNILPTPSCSLEERHREASQKAQNQIEKGFRWIGIGGGHDYGYSDGRAFLQSTHSSKQKPLVINFDAHLDVRNTTQGLSSGTPFFRLFNEFPGQFDLYQIGIQAQCNSTEHYNWCKERQVNILDFDSAFAGHGFFFNCTELLAEATVSRRPTYLSIDIDGFASAHAPGCSQSWPTGLEPNSFMRLLTWLNTRADIRALGIYEVSPPLDTDDQTAKLAALIIHRFIYGY